ncbi:MAG: glycoside hydrolase family 99 protein [Draconibacterium sp.]|nr:glycoside hydrolase family 99 protein [Draconibacterium sp.]
MGNGSVNYNVHTFYYGWFGNPKIDGKYKAWNHRIIPHFRDTTGKNVGIYPGGNDIGANFYPELGTYSSNDPEIISKHMEMIKEAGIGVLAISWWGPNHFTDKSVKTYLDFAQKFGLKITFHIEPVYKSAKDFKRLLEYLNTNYVHHPAIFKHVGKPMYYIYDSGKVKYYEWNRLLGEHGDLSIRGSELDGIFIGHWERRRDGEFMIKSGFDGFYTYYASEGFLYGCTSSNWPIMAKFEKENDLIFIPCPGPGYLDTRIRPWNTRNTKSRENGKYYERMFMNAVNVNPDFIGITSFNEWHEGTQIEPAVPKSIPGYTYKDYGEDTDPMFYIKKTKELVEKFEK